MHLTNNQTVRELLERIVLAPVEHPELLPSLLPIIAGAVVIELYFGKHESEELGWNTSVGNAVIWITTGLNLLLTSSLSSDERLATYSVLGLGGFVAYMNFYHHWSESIAFRVSSAGIIYTLAYLLVVMVKTSIPINETSLKAAGIFVLGSLFVFKLVREFERSEDEDEFMPN